MGRPMATSQDFVNWVCSDALDPQFLKYVLLAEHDSFLTFASGTTHQTIYFPEVKAFHVCLPPIETQRNIADVLATFDDLIENNLQRVDVLERMAEATYREWFVHRRYPGSESEATRATALGQLPESWDEGTISDLIFLQRGFDLPVGSRVPGPAPIIAASGLGGWHNEARVVGPGVATGRSGSVGVTTYVDRDYWPLNTALWVKEYRRSTPRHAYFLLRSVDLRSIAGGATMPMLNRNVVHGLAAARPPMELIDAFDTRVEPMFEARAVLAAESDSLQSIRNHLLPKLVTGQIDVSSLDLDAAVEASVA